MMSYKEFLDEPITIEKNQFMARGEYYKKYMHDINPKDFYDQLCELES